MSDFLRETTAEGVLFVPGGSRDEPSDSTRLLFYDTETTGLDLWQDRILQFAAVRQSLDGTTDSQYSTLCKPAADWRLGSAAASTHGIAMARAAAEGLPEPELARRIHRAMTRRNTVSVGYNSTHFDSVLVRALMYRNFYDPYLHEWDNGCARWDLFPVVRTFLALAPNSFDWQPRAGGGTSLTLVHVAKAAGIDLMNAHDALADTVALAEVNAALRRCSEPLWRAAFSRRRPDLVESDIGRGWRPHPMLLMTGFAPAEDRSLAFVAPVVAGRGRRGYVWDLRHDPRQLLDLSPELIANRLHGPDRLPLSRISTNASPQIFPLAREQAEQLLTPTGLQTVASNLRHLQDVHDEIAPRIAAALKVGRAAENDVDAALYTALPSRADLQTVNAARGQGPGSLAALMRNPHFHDSRMAELLWRYVARNHPDQLTRAERQRWDTEVRERISRHAARQEAA